MKPTDCRPVVKSLARRTKTPRALTDPLALIVWENIGYLIDDEKRASLFAEFERRIGLDAAAIARAKQSTLRGIAERGGMAGEKRAVRLREIATIVIENAAGDLGAHLKTLPPAKARALLKSFPSIGDPGADKILLFAGIDIRPALESNGLRAMLRLGLAREGTSYAASYKAATAVLAEHGTATRAWFMSAYHVLRAHGQTLCKRMNPVCIACPLDKDCAHERLKGQH